MDLKKLKVVDQGLAVVGVVNDGGDMAVMLPDGEVQLVGVESEAAAVVKQWAKKDLKRRKADAGLLKVEWRNGLDPKVETTVTQRSGR